MDIHFNRYFSNRWRSLIIFSMLGFCLIFFFRIVPDVMQILDLQKQLHANEKRIREAMRIENNLGQIQQRQQGIKKQIQNVVLSENQETQLSTILQQITLTASAHHVRIERIIPGNVDKKPTHVELPITFDLSCRYHQLGRFLNELETSQPVMKVRSVNITSESMVSSRLQVRIQLLVYYLEQHS